MGNKRKIQYKILKVIMELEIKNGLHSSIRVMMLTENQFHEKQTITRTYDKYEWNNIKKQGCFSD